MIDKKTYEDLMNYLVKTECNRLNHQDGAALKAPGPMIVSTPSHSSVKPGASHGAGNQTNVTASV